MMANKYFPVFLNVRHARCLIVGCGTVGCRKLADLLASDVAEIMVLETGIVSESLAELAKDGRVTVLKKSFATTDLIGMTLVFATTDDPKLNEDIMSVCKKQGILCDSATDPEQNDFIVPAVVQSGKISVAISTNGASPALSRHLKSEISKITEQYRLLADVLSRLRPLLLVSDNEQSRNAAIFETIVNSDLFTLLNTHNLTACEQRLSELLPVEFHKNIKDLLYGLW